MEITILCENASSDVGCLAEWGFSAFIRFKGTNVLFDTGLETDCKNLYISDEIYTNE